MALEVLGECLNSKKQEGGGLGSFHNPLYSFLLSEVVAKWREGVILDTCVRNGLPSSLFPALLQ